MIAIVDYGVGNLFSLRSSFAMIGAEAEVTGDAARLRAADRIILPGVGAFADAAAKLRATGLDAVLKEEAAKGKYLLGICLGMQLLFDVSHEFGVHPGLGLIPGDVVPMAGRISPDLKIPHIGWNALIFKQAHPLFRYIREGTRCISSTAILPTAAPSTYWPRRNTARSSPPPWGWTTCWAASSTRKKAGK